MNYPIGLQSFRNIRANGYVYIDKTSYIPLLLQNGQYKFLSRPRRFGKSLLLSTLEAFFKGERELFTDLAVDTLLPDPWPTHPVIHLDFSGEDYSTVDVLENKLDAFLSNYEADLGIPSLSHSFSERFRSIVRTLHQSTGNQVVILIDEYDNPITSAIGNNELQERFRAILYGFFSTLKSLDAHLRFCMLTGVTKYGHLSVFSGLNNLLDISFLNEFAGICGITQPELTTALHPGVEKLAREENCTTAEAYETLKNWYDGYHFSKSLLDVYNPYSVINSLARLEISDFWYRTGTPTILIKSLKAHAVDIATLNGAKASIDMLDNISALNSNPIGLFYQTGYLTIKDYDKTSRLFTLGYPNKEVESGLMDSILNVYGKINDSKVLVTRLREALENGEPEEFVLILKSFFAGIPYDLRRNIEKYENYYHTIFYVLLRLLGINVDAEYHTSEGSIDILIRTSRFIYVIELKINGDAKSAMQQINDHAYTAQFSSDSRKIIKIGIGFAENTHSIDSFLID